MEVAFAEGLLWANRPVDFIQVLPTRDPAPPEASRYAATSCALRPETPAATEAATEAV
eukprot:CAMPEP_0204541996 /NCGR_PEP_ID=MMETSP0661-20131031/18639_1 /ASSEMBLY_ACC=CAM_ASM_000606 /TAXON_ID=109239 /ORGANISM="Alexandrium margalefi, Strain AMGDE01CS-322" /LENGTH=57 /DNA_ID=CAMNT_0051548693 /DNA_START=73 /DNA_END=244 /DNA_ORIENTATION=+